jgi:uncharacterized protein YoxC
MTGIHWRGEVTAVNWYEISAVASASAIVVLVLYLLWTLRAAKEFMRRTDASITRFTETADETMRLSRQLMRAMRGMIDDVHAQSQKFQGVYSAVADFGGAVADAAAAIRQAAGTLARWAGMLRGRAGGSRDESREESSAKGREPSGRAAAGKDSNPEWMRIAIRLYRTWQDTNAQHAGASDAGRHEKE